MTWISVYKHPPEPGTRVLVPTTGEGETAVVMSVQGLDKGCVDLCLLAAEGKRDEVLSRMRESHRDVRTGDPPRRLNDEELWASFEEWKRMWRMSARFLDDLPGGEPRLGVFTTYRLLPEKQ